MIADIGDNFASRPQRTLYFVEEPAPGLEDSVPLSWKVDYRYPDGPRDAESAAIDTDGQRALILSKRDIPPRLYSVPLRPERGDTITATTLGTVNSLPAPSRRDIELAPDNLDWHWQPVGMDISDDNLAAVILTYRAVYYYRRQARQDWPEALNAAPLRIALGDLENAEAVAFGDGGKTVFVTGENEHSRVLRVDLAGVSDE